MIISHKTNQNNLWISIQNQSNIEWWSWLKNPKKIQLKNKKEMEFIVFLKKKQLGIVIKPNSTC